MRTGTRTVIVNAEDGARYCRQLGVGEWTHTVAADAGDGWPRDHRRQLEMVVGTGLVDG